MKILCCVWMIMLALCGVGCRSEMRVEPKVLAATSVVVSDELTPVYIGDRVLDAYRCARYLEFFVRVEEVTTNSGHVTRDGPYEVMVQMAHHRFKMLATDQKRGLIMGVSLFEGIHSELWPKDPAGIFHEASDHPQGRGDILRKENDDVECISCKVGSYLMSWVGDPGPSDETMGFLDMPAVFRNMILYGKRLSDVVQYGRDCYVFEQRIPTSEGGQAAQFITHIIYIEKTKYLVFRWETTIPAGTQRIREYDVVDASWPVQNMNWLISKNDNDVRIIPRIRD